MPSTFTQSPLPSYDVMQPNSTTSVPVQSRENVLNQPPEQDASEQLLHISPRTSIINRHSTSDVQVQTSTSTYTQPTSRSSATIHPRDNILPGNYQPRQRYIYGRIVQGRPGRRVRARHVRPRPSAPVAEPAFNYVTECDNSNSRCENLEPTKPENTREDNKNEVGPTEEVVCTICMHNIESVKLVPCSHKICNECALKLIEYKHDMCPFCRARTVGFM